MALHVFGDTGGHFDQLFTSLLQLGLNPDTFELPADVRVVHLGDLIHKGPKSNELVQLVEQILTANPVGQWVQLLGNHESQHIPGGRHFWSCDCNNQTKSLLKQWYREQVAFVAYGEGDFLFTHSGVTRSFWESVGKPANALDTAARLQALDAERAFQPGVMLGHRTPAGPVWALSTFEVFNSWNNSPEPMPFVQVHGHTSALDWEQENWYPAPDEFMAVAKGDPTSRALIVPVAGSAMIGLDPSFEKESPSLLAQPYLVLPEAE